MRESVIYNRVFDNTYILQLTVVYIILISGEVRKANFKFKEWYSFTQTYVFTRFSQVKQNVVSHL